MDRISLSEMVTFSPNKNIPIHRWFYYREGYSKAFVDWCIDHYSLKGPILDPFCGVGTTLLACKERGIPSIGCDVSPLARFVSETKMRNYTVEELQDAFQKLKQIKFDFPREGRVDSWFAKRFNAQTFRELMVVKHFVEKEMKGNPLQSLSLLALIDSTLRASNVERMGASLRRTESKGYKPIRKFWLQKLEYMLKDLKKSELSGPEPLILDDDARQLRHIESESVHSIITSPPYLNKIEYASAYKLELAIFFEEPKTQLRSFVGDDMRNGESDSELPIVDAYIKDMEKCFNQFERVLIPNGKAVINVAGACFPDRVVKSDDLLMAIAQEHGFSLVENIVARTIDCHKRHSGFVGKVNERVFVLEKK